MAEPDVGPVVRLPERVDRRTRLGPFPSARDALRFLCYATGGALLSPWISPFLWLPIVGGGFLVSVWQPDGRAADERAWTYLRWQLRGFARTTGRRVRREAPLTPRTTLRRASGEHLAVIRSAGCPMAYLPPNELERKFAAYCEFLRSLVGPFALLATTVAIHARPVRPVRASSPDGPEGEACRGYDELVELICRRRRIRRVYLALLAAAPGLEGLARLELEAGSLSEHLRGLGLHPVRLSGAALAEAAHGFDWI